MSSAVRYTELSSDDVDEDYGIRESADRCEVHGGEVMNYQAFAEAIRVINSHLGLELGLTARGDELKGVQPDTDEGGTCRFYLDKRCLEELAEAFASAASEIREPMTIEEIVAYYKEHS